MGAAEFVAERLGAKNLEEAVASVRSLPNNVHGAEAARVGEDDAASVIEAEDHMVMLAVGSGSRGFLMVEFAEITRLP